MSYEIEQNQNETEKTSFDSSIFENEQLFREFCATTHPATVAEVLSELEEERIVPLLLSLDLSKKAEIFGNLPPAVQLTLVERLKQYDLALILQKMSPDERADVFRILEEDVRESVLPLMAHAEREDLRKLGSYEEGTAGSVMTSDYATLSPHLTAKEALEKLRLEAPNKETIYNSYVIDPQRRLLGVVSLQDLILAPPGKKIEDIMKKDVISANVRDRREDVARKFSKFDLLALPIINGGDALVGIVTVDDVLDVNEEEATTDFHRLGSSTPIGMSLKDAGFLHLFSKRIPWLMALVFMNIFSGAGIAYFESTIMAVVALVFFLPLLIDCGGNAGSQSATLMVRALATGDVRTRDWFNLLGKEIFVALMLGLTMALGASLIGYYRAGAEVATVVAISMIIVVFVGSLIGMSLPFIFTRLKMDPATASAPLITSIADIAGVIIYFSVASWYLGIGGH